MKSTATRRWDRDSTWVALLASCVSILAFTWYLVAGDLLLYGDAVAHINIARRVFDSRTPGLLQLGTVWLPLPHLLIIPFILSISSWSTGLGGSVPSLAAYVAAVVGLFRLVRTSFASHSTLDARARLTAWFAAVIYAANPNLIYLQATAMTESLYLALFVWSVVFFADFVRALNTTAGSPANTIARSLLKCGLCLAGAELTRYDGWFAAVVMVTTAVLIVFRKNRHLGLKSLTVTLATLRLFILSAAAAPTIWLIYNAAIYRNPLEFAIGPYSARAIEQRNAVPGYPPHPGSHDLRAAAQYFVKSAELSLAEGNTPKLWVFLAVAGVAVVLAHERRLAPFLLLWVPLPFYVLSVAYAGTPIFVPVWWPFSYYNVRYGIQLLPAVAIFFAVSVYFLTTLARSATGKAAVTALAAAVVIASYASVWRAQPVSFREAWVNSRSRVALERALAANLGKMPPEATLLMYLGDRVGALQRA